MIDAAYAFSEHVAGASYARLAPEAIARAKQLILDSIGVTIAGSTAPGIAGLVKTVSAWAPGEGLPTGRVAGHAQLVAPPYAALCNGAMATCRDFDDTLDEASLHSMPSILWACLAVADAAGGVSGRDLLEAIVLGVEVHGRVGAARRTGQNFTPTSNASVFGAAAVCAKLLGLNRAGIHDAMGIAYSQAAGTVQPLVDGALVKRCQAGFGGQAGVLSAFLARDGLTGAKNFLEGPFGYFTLYERGNYNRARLLDHLGSGPAEYLRYSIKPYPCGRDVHGAVEAALQLRATEAPGPAEIAAVTVWLPDNPFRVSSKPYSAWSGDRNVEAVISACWPVAVALVHGDVFLHHFTADGLLDQEVRDIASRIVVRKFEGNDLATFTPQRVDIKLTGGREVSATVDTMLGHPERPLTESAVQAKFFRTATFGTNGMTQTEAAAVAQTVASLETLPDVRTLTAMIAAPR